MELQINRTIYMWLIVVFIIFEFCSYVCVEANSLRCHDGYCGNLSYEFIEKKFSGLFYSEQKMQGLMIKENMQRSKLFDVTPVHYRGDDKVTELTGTCCPSIVRYIINDTLTNIWGESKTVIHLYGNSNASFQYIPHAMCVWKGACAGYCTISTVTMSILVLDPHSQYKFDIFEIPGYCSCKNVFNPPKTKSRSRNNEPSTLLV